MGERSDNFLKVFAVILQNQQGVLFHSKYYPKHFSRKVVCQGDKDLTKPEHQRAFEKALLNKAKRMQVLGVMKPDDIEIFNYGRFVVLFKLIGEVHVYVVADQDENEILLSEVLNCFQKVVGFVTKQTLTSNHIYNVMQEVILIIDEIIDEGIPVTLEPELIYSRIKMKDVEPASPQKPAEQQKSTLSSLFGFAKTSLQKTLNLG